MMPAIQDKVLAGERISFDEGLFLLSQADLLEVGALANEVRFKMHPRPLVTYVVDTNLNYTNVCDAYCSFCAFYRPHVGKHADAYTHSIEEMVEAMGKAVAQGCTTVLMQGGLNPELPMSYYVDMVRAVRRAYPELTPHFWSPPEIYEMAKVSGLTYREVLQRLWDAGQFTLPGGGAEVLTNEVRRKISPLKMTADEWIEVERQAHLVGFRGTATMMYGHLDEDRDIIEHLERVRSLQDETGGFTAFVPWSFKKTNTALDRRVKTEAGPNRYLRIIAVARVYLDNFEHVDASWFSEGKKTGQVALHFGASDFGGTLFEENVLQEAGFYNRTTVEEIRTLIREAGFVPAQRDTLYQILRVFDEAPQPATV